VLMRWIVKILIKGKSAYQSVGFSDYIYLGCALNVCRTVSEMFPDEIALYFLDRNIDLKFTSKLIGYIDSPCSVSWCWGRNLNDVDKIYGTGVERLIFNLGSAYTADAINAISNRYGLSSCVLQINVYRKSGTLEVLKSRHHPNTSNVDLHRFLLGDSAFSSLVDNAGECIFQSVDAEGAFGDVDKQMIELVGQKYAFQTPFVFSGGFSEDTAAALDCEYHPMLNGIASSAMHFFSNFTLNGMRIDIKSVARS
jgi:imidazole glycerol phosphate synthase subunit HisF